MAKKQPDHIQTSHPERFLGRLPNDPSKPRVRLRRLPGVTITPPASVDWVSKVPGWNMALNSNLGDCVCAGWGHIVTQVEKYGQAKDVVIPDSETLKMYEVIGGYVPGKPNTDQGAMLQDGLNYARKTGLGGVKVAAFAQIDATDIDLIKNCIAVFGSVYTGFNFPASAMDQFNAGQPWDVVKRSKIEGGHCVPLMAYDATGFTAVTWGATQRLTNAFLKAYFDEFWVGVNAEWLAATGLTPGGIDSATANSEYQELTNDNESPFPAVAPAPPVDPPVDPPVNPPSDDAVTLLTEVKSEMDALSAAVGAFLAESGGGRHHGH